MKLICSSHYLMPGSLGENKSKRMDAFGNVHSFKLKLKTDNLNGTSV